MLWQCWRGPSLQKLLQIDGKLVSLATFATIINGCLSRRNETVYGIKTVIGNQAVTVNGDDAKTFQAAIIEYSKEQPAAKVRYLYWSLTLAAYTDTSYANF